MDINEAVEEIEDALREASLPLPVAPDWARQLNDAERMTALIDRHLNYEEAGRRDHFGDAIKTLGAFLTPACLCPSQRIALITDMLAVTWETAPWG